MVERLQDLEDDLNHALVAQVPSRVWCDPQDTASDFRGRSYYGKTNQEDGLWVWGKAKEGTTR